MPTWEMSCTLIPSPLFRTLQSAKATAPSISQTICTHQKLFFAKTKKQHIHLRLAAVMLRSCLVSRPDIGSLRSLSNHRRSRTKNSGYIRSIRKIFTERKTVHPMDLTTFSYRIPSK